MKQWLPGCVDIKLYFMFLAIFPVKQVNARNVKNSESELWNAEYEMNL